jgi:hypothetical protein
MRDKIEDVSTVTRMNVILGGFHEYENIERFNKTIYGGTWKCFQNLNTGL